MKNVIFILSDQHNAKMLGCKNHPNMKTPNLDNLAAQGVRFDNAICQNPICTPSRVSWISGQYCHNHGHYGLEGENPHGLPTVFGHFRNQGYRTGAIGKIHCPEYWVEDDCDTFIEARGCSIGKSPEYSAYMKANGLNAISDEKTIEETGYCGSGQCVDGMPSRLTYQQSQEKYIVDRSIDFIKDSVQKDKPFFLHTSFGKPHQPYIPAKEFWDLYPDESIELPPNVDYDMSLKGPQLQRMRQNWDENTTWFAAEPRDKEHGMRRKLRAYMGCISQVDHAVGELVAYLEEANLIENTIIVYSSDHGDYACEHGLLEKAPGICGDAISRIPLIVRYPNGEKKNVVIPDVVQTIDMIPTLCQMIGIPNLETADGKDRSALVLDKDEPYHPENVAITEYAWSKSMRKGAYRYVYYPKKLFAADYPDGFGELYNVEEDPWEMHNLFFEPEYQDLIRSMRDELMDLLITSTRVRTCECVRLTPSAQRTMRYGKVSNGDGKFSIEQLKEEEKVPAWRLESYI